MIATRLIIICGSHVWVLPRARACSVYTHTRRKQIHPQSLRQIDASACAVAMATSSATPVVCLGCGQPVRRSTDRRKLTSSASQHVLPLWKTTIASALEKRNQLADLDSLSSGCMCRTCFYAYEKVVKSKAIIEANAAKGLDSIVPANAT